MGAQHGRERGPSGAPTSKVRGETDRACAAQSFWPGRRRHVACIIRGRDLLTSNTTIHLDLLYIKVCSLADGPGGLGLLVGSPAGSVCEQRVDRLGVELPRRPAGGQPRQAVSSPLYMGMQAHSPGTHQMRSELGQVCDPEQTQGGLNLVAHDYTANQAMDVRFLSPVIASDAGAPTHSLSRG